LMALACFNFIFPALGNAEANSHFCSCFFSSCTLPSTSSPPYVLSVESSS
jgi:hypothetical protein